MRWVAIFQDKPSMLIIRKDRELQHLEYLRQHEHEIVIAGGLCDVPNGAYVGGLWVLEVASRERAAALVESDPYFVPAHRSYQLFTWGKAFVDKEIVL